jgi:hypothetical protein
MARKPTTTSSLGHLLLRWDIYRAAAKAKWIGTVEALTPMLRSKQRPRNSRSRPAKVNRRAATIKMAPSWEDGAMSVRDSPTIGGIMTAIYRNLCAYRCEAKDHAGNGTRGLPDLASHCSTRHSNQ